MAGIFGRTGVLGWKPTDISGCVLWLRSDLDITKEDPPSNLVQIWGDQSVGGNNDFSQTTDDKPVWNSNQINGYPAITFDGSNDWMDQVNPANILWAADFSLFVVLRVHTIPVWPAICSQVRSDRNWSVGAKHISVGNAAYNYKIQSSQYAVAPDYWSTSGVTLNQWHILAFTHKQSTDTMIAYFNGGDAESGTRQFVAEAANMELGRNGNQGQLMDGDYAEMIWYNSVLLDTDRIAVRNYLNTRYLIF